MSAQAQAQAHAQAAADPGPDLFPEAAEAPPPSAHTMAIFAGRLVHNAEVRSAIDAAGLTVPCLQFELMPDKAWPVHPVRVQQLFPAGNSFAAEAAARRYLKGTHITVQTPVLALRLSIPAATHIHLDPEPPA